MEDIKIGPHLKVVGQIRHIYTERAMKLSMEDDVFRRGGETLELHVTDTVLHEVTPTELSDTVCNYLYEVNIFRNRITSLQIF